MKRTCEGVVKPRLFDLPLELREQICDNATTYYEYINLCYALKMFPRGGIEAARVRFSKFIKTGKGFRYPCVMNREGKMRRVKHPNPCAPFVISKHGPQGHVFSQMDFSGNESGIGRVERNNRSGLRIKSVPWLSGYHRMTFCSYGDRRTVFRLTEVCFDWSDDGSPKSKGVLSVDAEEMISKLWRELKMGKHTFDRLWERFLALNGAMVEN